MSTKNPRVNAVFEEPLFRSVEALAKREKVSLSQKVRDLVRDALDLVEDEGLEAIVEKRRSAENRRWVRHADVRKRFKI
jgi:hypothetical protein